MRPLRIAVIGAGAQPGSRARQYLATLACLPDHYILAAVCDRNAEVSQWAATTYGAQAHYSDVRELFAAEQPDVVLSLAPKDSHIVIALTAARLGIHVLTEIPVAHTRRYAAAIAQACHDNGVLWEVAEQVWLWPQEQLKQRLLASGQLGEVTHARLWYQTGQYHGFSGVRQLIGAEATRVLGHSSTVASAPYTAYGGERETTVRWDSAVIEFANGVTCLFEKAPRAFPLRTYPQGWQIEGTKGVLEHTRCVLWQGAEERPYEIEEAYDERGGERVLRHVRVDTEPPVVWENPFQAYRIGSSDDVAKAAILTSFHEAITGGGGPAYGVENALRDWELCLATRESADRGNTWVELPLQEPTALERQLETAYVRRYGYDPIEETERLLDRTFTRSAVMWPLAHWL